MLTPEQRMLATHALDQLDGAMAELQHHLNTGERAVCPRCAQIVPAVEVGTPVRHKNGGQWCEPTDPA